VNVLWGKRAVNTGSVPANSTIRPVLPYETSWPPLGSSRLEPTKLPKTADRRVGRLRAREFVVEQAGDTGLFDHELRPRRPKGQYIAISL
jgi:hypothetical protein